MTEQQQPISIKDLDREILKWEERQHTANMHPRNCFFISVGKEAKWRLEELREQRRKLKYGSDERSRVTPAFFLTNYFIQLLQYIKTM